MADPYHYVRLNPGPAQLIISLWGAPITRPGEADDGGVRFEAIEAWIRAFVPELGKEVHPWSRQVLDKTD